MNRRLLLLSAIFVFATAPFVGADENCAVGSLHIVSFNVRYNNPGDGENSWPHRRDWVAEIIRREKTDIAGLQEVLKSQFDDLAVRLSDYAIYGVGRNDGKELGEYAPILYRKDRFELVDKGQFWLSATPEVVGSVGWDANQTRIATWVKLCDRKTKKNFLAINTHFDHVGQEARRESAKLIVAKTQKLGCGLPVIITGDFNSRPTSEAYKTITDESSSRIFYDAFARTKTAHQGPDSTWSGFRKVLPGQRIDFVFVTDDVTVLSHKILAEQRDGRFPSDHLPIVTLLKLN